MKLKICTTDLSHLKYAEEICYLMYISAQERDTGIAKRDPEYIKEKIRTGKSVIALCDDKFAGYSYIETWGHKKFVANSGLVVSHEFRQAGLATKIKKKVFELSRSKYPNSKIFSITTGLAVMRLNSNLGFRPVPFSELTEDAEFWNGCRGCKNYDVLERNNYKVCLCTGLLYNPQEHKGRLDITKQFKKIISTVNRKSSAIYSSSKNLISIKLSGNEKSSISL